MWIVGPCCGQRFALGAVEPPIPSLANDTMIARMRELLDGVGLRDREVSMRSCRVGAATQAARSGIPASVAMRMGRWKSATVHAGYVRTANPSSTHAASLMGGAP